MSLNKNTLKSEIKDAFEQLLPVAFEEAYKCTLSCSTEIGKKNAKKFAETITELLSEPLSAALAGAIDYHVRSANVYGFLITAGSPTTHTCNISSPFPPTNGKVPNSLGIQ